MNYDKNTEYIFIPFTFEKPGDFAGIVETLNKSGLWAQVHDEITYMLKYVADKINSKDPKNCQCFHYELRDEAREAVGIEPKDKWYSCREHEYKGNKETFPFQIFSVQLYCFSTSVCILAFRLRLEKEDPFWVSSALYYIKKVSRELISPVDEGEKATTMLKLSKALVSELEAASPLNFFYYANPSTERANVLTYLQVDEKDDYKEELFFLRRCYSDGFSYVENQGSDEEEILKPSQSTVWGISPEAAVCLVCMERGNEKFIRQTFYKNFNAQYLFMYVLLLHQKYALYMFLTKIGIGINNQLATLEDYRNQLYEFETDFVFSFVTEVPQYQNLYDKMVEAFALKRMYEDVHEPLLSLSEARRTEAENEQKKRDKKQKKRDDSVNKALLMLSVLSFFSALVDSYDFVNSFVGWFLSPIGVKVVQVICIVVIVIIGVFVFKNLIGSKDKKEDKNK